MCPSNIFIFETLSNCRDFVNDRTNLIELYSADSLCLAYESGENGALPELHGYVKGVISGYKTKGFL